MEDAEMLQHEATWKGFTTLLKYCAAAIIVILVLMALTLVH
jgi:hypothetical protein